MLQKSEFFNPIDKSEQDSEFIAMEPRSFWHDVWDRFRSNRRALIGLIVLLFIRAPCRAWPSLFAVSV